MSEQELEAKMKQILDDYAPILNVTPEAALLDQKPSQTKAKKKQTKPKNIAANQTSKKKQIPTPTPGQTQIVKI